MAKLRVVMLQRKLAGWKLATDKSGDQGREGLRKNMGPWHKKAGCKFLRVTSAFLFLTRHYLCKREGKLFTQSIRFFFEK